MLQRKRKTHSDMEASYEKKTRRIKPRLKLEDAPPVKSIRDLIEIGKTIKFYKNLDTVMLWRITPHLEELNKMVGMESLKESIFYQVIYYLQGMHTKNKNEEYLHTVIYGSPGCGKCLGKNTPVMMHDGSIKLVQDVVEGDLLMGDDSTPRTVLSTCTGKEKMYKVKQGYGDSYIVNSSHILSLKLSKSPRLQHDTERGRFCVSWFDNDRTNCKTFPYRNSLLESKESEAREFLKSLPPKGTVIDISIQEYLSRPKGWIAAYKGYKVGVDFPKQKVDLDPYVLGYWLGNGTQGVAAITTADPEPLEYFKEQYPELYVKTTQKITHRFSTCSRHHDYKKNPFVNSLRKYGVFKDKHIPDEYKYTDRQTRLEVLAGLLDSDGHNAGNYYDFIQKRKPLSEDVVWVARSLGLRAAISECQKSCMYKGEKKTGTYYRVSISGNTDEIPCKIPRKKCSPRKQIKDALVYGIEIEELPEDDYYGFEIDGNRRFLLGDFTVTHNTTVAKVIGKLYQAMNVLSPTGIFKVAYRDDFVAGYLGQTATKTKKLLSSCIGGVLFIDEVYALAPRSNDRDSFSKEAIDTINAFLSEHKNDFCCIIAGYEDEVNNCFFAMNKGLERRFPWVHRIEEYTSKNLYDIFIKMVKDVGWDVSFDEKTMIGILEQNKRFFKNAGGDIETFLTKCKMFHSKRVFSLGKEHKFILSKDDVKEALQFMEKRSVVKEDKPPDGMYT